MTEVPIVQFLRPDGRKRLDKVDLPDEIAQKAADMYLSSEVLRTGEIALYARFKDQPDEAEELMIATNAPGPRQPDLVLVHLIGKVWMLRHG